MMRSRVLIAGGGVASLEAALALRDLVGERVAVEIFSPRREFVYRPYAVGEPYGTAQVTRYDLESLAARCDARFHLDSIASVECEPRLVTTHDGERYTYDYLVVASGAKQLWPVPGALTFWGIAEEAAVAKLVETLRQGELTSVAFTCPSPGSWTLPMYELALQARAQLAAAGIDDVRLLVVTPEDAPLSIFGRRASEQVAALLEARRVEVMTGAHPVRYEKGRLEIAPGEPLEVGAALSLPRLEGRRIRGVPHDPEGFVPVDDHCAVIGRERLYAAGDVTAFPVKQGGIATQQADAVAEAIAAELGAPVEARPLDPILRAVLWTGEEPLYLEGWLEGGHGETSSLSAEPPWGGTDGKIVGRYLTDFVAGLDRELAGGRPQ